MSLNNPDRPTGTSSFSPEGHYLGHDSGAVAVAPGGRDNILAILTKGGSPVVMAQYSRGKPIPSNPSVISAVRQGCIDAVQRAGENPITVIGLRLPEKNDPDDDRVLTDLFGAIRNHGGAKTYVGPDEAECERAKKEYGMDARCVDLATFLESHRPLR